VNPDGWNISTPLINCQTNYHRQTAAVQTSEVQQRKRRAGLVHDVLLSDVKLLKRQRASVVFHSKYRYTHCTLYNNTRSVKLK